MRFPLSFRGRNRNSSQEAGSAPLRSAANIQVMPRRMSPPAFRYVWSAFVARLIPLFPLFILWILVLVTAHAAIVATPRVTLVVFSDKHLTDEEWTDLAVALRHTFENAVLESHSPIGGFDMVRGDTLSPGAVFETVIPVYLHGECRLLGQPGQEDVRGPLGWVFRSHGHIEPFIHVDCTRLSGVLGHQALWMNHGTRNAALAEAVAHVVLHEWIHIATQSSAHTRDGIFKDSFGVADLVPGYARILPHSGGK
jgi:hypothetical protein